MYKYVYLRTLFLNFLTGYFFIFSCKALDFLKCATRSKRFQGEEGKKNGKKGKSLERHG
jgi:hypothetical protein